MAKKKKELLKVARDLIEETCMEASASVEGVHSCKEVGVDFTKDNKVDIDCYIIAKYGVKIPDLAWNVQTMLKETVHLVTNFKVNSVNIHVQGVKL